MDTIVFSWKWNYMYYNHEDTGTELFWVSQTFVCKGYKLKKPARNR